MVANLCMTFLIIAGLPLIHIFLIIRKAKVEGYLEKESMINFIKGKKKDETETLETEEDKKDGKEGKEKAKVEEKPKPKKKDGMNDYMTESEEEEEFDT